MSNREKRLRRAQQLAIDGILHASQAFKDASYYELSLVCNGCGAANSKFKFPNKMYGTYTGYACDVHDWDYEEGETEEDKVKADKYFKKNLNIIIDREKAWYKPKFLMKRRAYKYYLGVKYLGDDAFWKGKR